MGDLQTMFKHIITVVVKKTYILEIESEMDKRQFTEYDLLDQYRELQYVIDKGDVDYLVDQENSWKHSCVELEDEG